MNYFPLTQSQLDMQTRVAGLAEKVIAPRAAGYDARAEYPRESLEALRDAEINEAIRRSAFMTTE